MLFASIIWEASSGLQLEFRARSNINHDLWYFSKYDSHYETGYLVCSKKTNKFYFEFKQTLQFTVKLTGLEEEKYLMEKDGFDWQLN